MSEPKLPPDVDALARRLPRREPAAERSQAMRHAIVDAAQGQGEPVHGQRWWIGVAAAAAACVAAWLVMRGSSAPTPSMPAPAVATAASPATPLAPSPSAAPPAPSAVRAAPKPQVPAAVPVARIPDGVTAFATTTPLTLSRGDETITAPPAARFDVEVSGDQVKRITVTEGWVVVAGAHATTTIVPMRHTWTPPAPPPSAETPATAPAVPAASSAIAAPVARSAAPRLAAAGSTAPSTEPVPGPATPPSPPRAPLPAAAERDFRDGLRTLLAGDPAAASAPLDRACGVPSNSQDDACYWVAVAWLRSGDHARARRGFHDLLARWPGSGHAGEANVALGWLLLEVGDTAEARTRFAAAADDRLPTVRASALRGLAAAQ
jgi:TolA-binding protein